MILCEFGSTFFDPLSIVTTIVPTGESSAVPPEKQHPPFAITLLTFTLSVAVFAGA